MQAKKEREREREREREKERVTISKGHFVISGLSLKVKRRKKQLT